MLSKKSLAVPASPAAVRVARVWVGAVLRDLGRDDLVFAGELGVSELVTNAILHAEPPLTVRVRGTADHPRIEVTDHSPERIKPAATLRSSDDEFLATFGRGLSLVAMNSLQWGSTCDIDGIGKTVWFEPSPQPVEDLDIPGPIEDFGLDESDTQVEVPADSIPIVLRGVPAVLFGNLRRYHFELRREMRLLALSDPERYPVAVHLTEVFARADGERRASSGVNRLDEAIARKQSVIDLEYAVPATAPDTMAELVKLFELCNRLFADERLLSMSPPAHLVALQDWYFNEFIQQGKGAAPIAWVGPTQFAAASVS